MALRIPKYPIESFDDYRHWLCNNGLRNYEEVWLHKNKAALLHEYVAVCYAKKIPIKIEAGDTLTMTYLANKS